MGQKFQITSKTSKIPLNTLDILGHLLSKKFVYHWSQLKWLTSKAWGQYLPVHCWQDPNWLSHNKSCKGQTCLQSFVFLFDCVCSDGLSHH